MNPNWRMWPLCVNLMLGTMALFTSSFGPYPRLSFALAALGYGMAAYVAWDWIRRIRKNAAIDEALK
jgi:CHASE1-domain containing sensor protein